MSFSLSVADQPNNKENESKTVPNTHREKRHRRTISSFIADPRQTFDNLNIDNLDNMNQNSSKLVKTNQTVELNSERSNQIDKTSINSTYGQFLHKIKDKKKLKIDIESENENKIYMDNKKQISKQNFFINSNIVSLFCNFVSNYSLKKLYNSQYFVDFIFFVFVKPYFLQKCSKTKMRAIFFI